MPFNIQRVIYFLGIGGIGMSAMARYFLAKGYIVHGYDRTPTKLTQSLEKEGMVIHYDEDPNLVPGNTGTVIYTPAIPKENTELQHFRKLQIPMFKRAEVLGMLSNNYKTIACAGTHGKTTTSTLVAHLLHSSHLGCQAFLGGISKNYQSNLLLSDESDILVTEADEFDRSFLHLKPYIAIITSIDADHLDVYGNRETLVKAFSSFTEKIAPNGFLILKKGLNLPTQIGGTNKIYTYSVNEKADYDALNICLIDGFYQFDLDTPQGLIRDLTLGIPGLYNVENAVAASAAALLCGVTADELLRGLASFKGVGRRFEIRVNEKEIVYIDDYAHHPEEIAACIRSARALFHNKKITGIFQPHLFSRTRDFAEAFAESLYMLDEVILLPVYPAREQPLEGVDSEMLLSLISNTHKVLLTKSDLPQFFDNLQLEVVLTMGAGDIDTLPDILENYFKTEYHRIA